MPAPKKPGRPTAFNPETAKAILAYIRKGAYLKQAALAADVDQSTLRKWRKLGREKPDSEMGVFERSIRRAQARAEVQLTANWYDVALRDPDHAAKFLAVRWRRRWNPTHKMELTGKNEGPVLTQDQATAQLVTKLEKMEASLRAGKTAPSSTGPKVKQ